MKKPEFAYAKTKAQISFRGDQRLCFRYMDSTIPLLLKPEIQASSLILLLYEQGVCVGPGRNPKLLVFSCSSSYANSELQTCILFWYL